MLDKEKIGKKFTLYSYFRSHVHFVGLEVFAAVTLKFAVV
jgi:hypothetical protein